MVVIRSRLYLAILLILAPATAEPRDYQCRNGSDVRRIEIHFADQQGSLPCRVLYRPETAQSAVGTVAWRSLSSLTVCQHKADQLVDRLTTKGWTCETGAPDTPRPSPARPIEPETGKTKVAEARATEPTTRVGREAAERALARPRVTQPDDPAFPSPESEVTERQADEPVGPELNRSVPSSPTIGQPPLVTVDPNLGAPPRELTALVEANMRSLSGSFEGRFQAEIAHFGDLDGDRLADAVVLYTMESEDALAYRQFLAIYLFDGVRHQLTTTRSVGGSYRGAREANVEGIEQGVINLSLRTFEPGDAACCPTGQRQMAFMLQNLELIQVDARLLP